MATGKKRPLVIDLYLDMFAAEHEVTDGERVVISSPVNTTARSFVAAATSPGQKQHQQDKVMLAPHIGSLLAPEAAPAAPRMDLWGVVDGHGHLGGRAAEVIRDVSFLIGSR